MKYFWLAFGLFFVTVIGLWCLVPARFTLKNESGQELRSLTVIAAGTPFQFENVPPGGEVFGWFYFHDEVVLEVDGTFADGNTFSDFCGYLVWEDLAPHLRMALEPDGAVREERFRVTASPQP